MIINKLTLIYFVFKFIALKETSFYCRYFYNQNFGVVLGLEFGLDPIFRSVYTFYNDQ